MKQSIGIVTAVVALPLGAVGGYAVAAATVEPETIVETETVTETFTETVEVTPRACADALDAAAAVHLLLIDKWTTAVGVGDAGDFDELIGELDSLSETTDLDAATEQWWSAREDCLATL